MFRRQLLIWSCSQGGHRFVAMEICIANDSNENLSPDGEQEESGWLKLLKNKKVATTSVVKRGWQNNGGMRCVIDHYLDRW